MAQASGNRLLLPHLAAALVNCQIIVRRFSHETTACPKEHDLQDALGVYKCILLTDNSKRESNRRIVGSVRCHRWPGRCPTLSKPYCGAAGL